MYIIEYIFKIHKENYNTDHLKNNKLTINIIIKVYLNYTN